MTDGGPTVRKADVPGGNRMAQEAKAGRPKGRGNQDSTCDGLSVAVVANPPDTGPVPGPERALTWAG